jgi:two-component system, LytTR family, response regulator
MRGQVILDHLAVLHHEPNPLQFGNVGERIASNGDEISKFSRLNCTDAVLPAQHLRRIRGDGTNDVQSPATEGSGMKALLVDDERLARAGLRRMLALHPDVSIAGEAANAEEAGALIVQLRPDLLFLDIEMPGTSGLDLLEQLEDIPLIIFTTAYPQHAVRAFEVNALDYLVKPIVSERLAGALEKARKATTQKTISTRHNRHILLRDGDRCWLVSVDRIQLLESAGNYTRVYFEESRESRPLVYRSLSALQARLDPADFFRVSRSHIVNLRKILSLQPKSKGNLVATLPGGLEVTISRRCSRRLRRALAI